MSVRSLRPFLIFLFGLVAIAARAGAADNFPGTTLTGSSGTVTGTTVGMTGETGEPNFIGAPTTSEWFSWTAPTSGYFTIGTCNLSSETTTATDTTLAAYTGAAVNALTAVQTDDDSTGCNSTVSVNYGSTLAFNAVAGTTYRFQVDTYSSSTQGTFVLRYGYAGLTVAITDSTTTEGTPVTDTATFTVVPTSVIGVTGSASMVVTIGASSPASQCTFSPSTLTFTKSNWTTPQTVTVSAVDDATVEGTHSCKPASIVADANYNSTAVATGSLPTLTIYDNDNPNFTITKAVSAGSIAAPGTLTYTITVDNNGSAILTSPVITDTLKLNATTLTPTSGPTLTSGDTNADGKLQDTETWIYTVTYAVTQADIDTGGSITNVSTWACAQLAAKTSNTVTTGITQSPNYTITKSQSSGPSPITAAGQVIGYSFSVANTGNVTLTTPAVTTDTFQLGGSNRTLTSGPTLSSGDTNSNGRIDVGETWVYNATYTVPQTDMDGTGSYTNQVTYSTANGGSKNSNTVTTNVTRTASLTLVKAQSSGPSPITAAGQVIGYTVTVTNTGNQTLNTPALTDTFQLGGAARTLTSGPTLSGDTNANGRIEPTETWTYSASYTVPQTDIDGTGSFTNVATLTTAQVASTTSNTVTTAVTRSPSMTVVKAQSSGANPVTAAGQTIGYSITISNTGNQTLTGMSISDTLKLGVAARTLTSGPTYSSGDTNSNGRIDLTEVWVYTASYTVTQADIDGTGSFANFATYTTAQVAATNSNTVTTPVTRSPAMTVGKTLFSGPSPVTAAGQTLTYRVTITNTGNQTLTSPSISDNFQLGGSARTLTSGPSYLSGDANSNGSIDVGEVWLYSATYTVPQTDIDGTGSFTNAATFTTTQVPATTSSTVTTNVTRTASLTLVKAQSSGPSPITAAGQVIGYTVTVTNTGNQTLNTPALTDTFQLGGTARTLTSGPTLSGDTNANGRIEPTETWVYSATYTVPQSDIDGTGSFTNVATLTTAQVASTTSNTVTTNVTRTASFTISKARTTGPTPVTAAGQTMGYGITVVNTGNRTLTSPTLTDALLLNASARTLTSGPTLASGDTNSNGRIDVGETWVYNATYTATQTDMDAGGTFSNTATMNTAQVGPTTSSAVTTAITQTSTIGIAKSWAFAPGGDLNGNSVVDAGDTLKYTYLVSNTGNVTLANVHVTDAHLGLGTAPVPAPANVASLSPGANTTFTSTYVVVQADIDHQ